MATLKIENLPDPLYAALRARAESHSRSIAEEVIDILAKALGSEKTLSILDLQGLGKDLWDGIDPARYVEEERASWD